MLTGHQQNAQRFSVAVAARYGVMHRGERFAGGPVGIGRIGLATRAAARPFGASHLDNALTCGQ